MTLSEKIMVLSVIVQNLFHSTLEDREVELMNLGILYTVSIRTPLFKTGIRIIVEEGVPRMILIANPSLGESKDPCKIKSILSWPRLNMPIDIH